MVVTDHNLRQRFTRQPRALGTCCIYAPKNTLLKHADLEYGCSVRIVGHPVGRNDLFVDVVMTDNFPRPGYEQWGKEAVSAEWLAKRPIHPELIKSVMWRDLAQ